MPELTDSQSLKQRIIDESKEYVVLPPGENEFTIKDFMEAHGENMTEDRARLALEKMEKEGKIYSRKGLPKSRKGSCNVYGFR